MLETLLMVSFGVVILILFIWLKTYKTRQLIDQIPGPATVPIVGNALQMKPGSSGLYDQFMELAREYGGGMFRFWMGPVPVVLLYKAENVEALLSGTKHINKVPGFCNAMSPWLWDWLAYNNGDKWKQRRRLLTPTFHFKILEDFLSVINEHAQILVTKLDTKYHDGVFNIFNDITLCTLDIICETAMGRNVNVQVENESIYANTIQRISELIISRMKKPWLSSDWLYNTFSHGKEFNRCLEIVHDFTNRLIAERIQEVGITSLDELTKDRGNDKRRLALLDMLLCTTYDDSSHLSEDDIREEVDTIMFAGHDSTAAGINWAIYLLGRHPDIQDRLHEEMERIFGANNREATMEDIKEMKYLECVIKEQLRLYPSVPLFGRVLSDEANIGGYVIPKGTGIAILPAMVHQDERFFPNPEEFKPERFTSDNITGRHPFAYIPFSAGMRNCIGQRFALLEEKVILSSLVRRFRIDSMQAREDLHPIGDIILRPRDGIFVNLTPR